MSLHLRMDFPSVPAFLAAFDKEMVGGSLTVPRAPGAGDVELFSPCEVELCLFGEPAILVTGWITHSVPGSAVGVLLGGGPGELAGLVERLRKLAKHITAPSIQPVGQPASGSAGAAARSSSPNLNAAVPRSSSPDLGAYVPGRASSPNLNAHVPARASSPDLGAYVPSRPSSSPNLNGVAPSRPSSSPNLNSFVSSRSSSSNLNGSLPSRPSSSPNLSSDLPHLGDDENAVVPPADEEARLAAQEPPPPRIPAAITARLDMMGMNEKMRLAMSGSRDERLAILRDINRTLHVFVLRNPRIGLDEVQYAARMANLSPDALKQIADHPQWGSDQNVCAGLARNPKTPLSVAMRCLDRIGAHELRLIARGGARQPIVVAARRLLMV